MDDFNLQSLRHSQNDQCSRLLDVLTPAIMQGFQFIYSEAVNACIEAGEPGKYLKTFQNLILRVPKWNATIIDTECARIMKESSCDYLEDLITCTHIIHLKMLTIARVGNKQKTIDIDIPKLNDFVHRVYIETTRKIYKNVYLYEANISTLQQQKNRHELEYLVKDAILSVVRESIPTERILRAYMNESIEEDVIEEVKEEIIPAPPPTTPAESDTVDPCSPSATAAIATQSLDQEQMSAIIPASLSFDNIDHTMDVNGKEGEVHASKELDALETISQMRHDQRKAEEAEDNEDTLVIGEELSMKDMDLDIQSLDPKPASPLPAPILMDIEILE